MARVVSKRMTAQIEGEFVVFLIGMRINRWWNVHKWWPAARAMPRMLRELDANPDLGLLGFHGWFGRTTIMVQYWRSLDHLMSYARSRDAEHLPAWREFNKRVGKSGDVGVWHETYVVPAGRYESVYHHMPLFGLAKASEAVDAVGHRATAHGRLTANPSAASVDRAA